MFQYTEFRSNYEKKIAKSEVLEYNRRSGMARIESISKYSSYVQPAGRSTMQEPNKINQNIYKCNTYCSLKVMANQISSICWRLDDQLPMSSPSMVSSWVVESSPDPLPPDWIEPRLWVPMRDGMMPPLRLKKQSHQQKYKKNNFFNICHSHSQEKKTFTLEKHEIS